MADRDDLDYFMEHAILSKDLRDLAARARSIRARERKLAELAHAMGAHLDTVNRALTLYEREWAERYEEACKP